MVFIICEKCKRAIEIKDRKAYLEYPDYTPCCNAEWSLDILDVLDLKLDARSVCSGLSDSMSTLDAAISIIDDNVINSYRDDNPKMIVNELENAMDHIDEVINDLDSLKDSLESICHGIEENVSNYDEFSDKY